MKRVLLIALSLAVAATLSACKKEKKPDDQGTAATSQPEQAPEKKEDWPKPAGQEPAAPAAGEATATVRPPTADDLAAYTSDLTGDGPLTATFETSKGTIHCELFDKGAPVTVANFIGLARGKHAFKDPKSGQVETRPYYDGTVFHRVIPEFMIQGGDPTATGSGDPGYQFATEVSPDLKHEPGTLSMANAGPDTNGAQFFITELAHHELDGKYNVFGRCKEIDVVKKIARVETKMQEGGGEKSRPVEEVKLEKVTISRGADGGAKGDGGKGDGAKGDKGDGGGKKKAAKADAKGDDKDKAGGGW
ncbi:MAG TPA: peptidylprolyl isomerase [Kofleriaceae bacterium]|nr:peptidylprolyl isomerase [Kofleriaceae bacterium]